ncbi:putative fatty acyl-CoA reductase CG8306 isoform X2 [Nilaparvata lugens]|nr:putative fatty acyl-CoA reductase CG8306 isoform X2 [Nilaparvata lugens]
MEDRIEMKHKVNFIFHSAATLDFEASLKTTVEINLLGTKRVAELSKEMPNLKAFVHVSSAYVNSNLKSADEVIYPAPAKVEDVISLVQRDTESSLNDLAPKMMSDVGHPNTYTFTKALAEHVVAGIPNSVIIRPSMIVGAWKEPIPGWTNSKNGPQGFIMGAAKGVVRRLPVDKNLIYDYIPVDVVVNHMILAAWHVVKNKPRSTDVFHVTTSTYKPFKWANVENEVTQLLHKYPLKSAVWYPTLKLLPSLFLFRVSAFIFHMIPAYILDTVTRIGGGRPILVRLHTNVNKSLGRLAPFIFNEWLFDNKQSLALHKSIPTAKEREMFGVDVGSLEWSAFFNDLAQGVREFLNNESPKTLASARKKDKVLYVLNVVLQVFVVSGIWYAFSCVFGQSMALSSFILPIIVFISSFL